MIRPAGRRCAESRPAFRSHPANASSANAARMAKAFLVSDAQVGITNARGATNRGAIRANARRSRIDSRMRRTSPVCRYRRPP